MLTFDATGDQVTIAATTLVGEAKPKTPEYAEAEEERSALLAERDEWSQRFAQANPETDRVTFERTHGKLTSAEHRATVATDQLQKFFFDTPITVTTTRGDGWTELAMYAGTSNRATPAQRRLAEKMLDVYSARAVRYFSAMRSMYAYLDARPQRAHDVFTDVFSGESEQRPLLSDRERSLSNSVRDSIDALVNTSDVDTSASVDRVFDLVYNPFPAHFKVAIHGNPLAVEGFNRIDSETFEINPPTALEAIGMLEGRWISPDPLALVHRTNDKKTDAELVAMIESLPRRTEPVVTQSEVAAAIVEKMRPAPRYRLRWVTRRPPAS